MSYDIYLEAPACVTCGQPQEGPERLNPTYNLTPIFDRALTGEPLPNPEISESAIVLFHEKTDRPRGLRMLSGRKAEDTIEWLTKALGHMNDPAQIGAFRALEPDNGWGTLDGAREVIERMIANARRYPAHVWSIG